MAWVKIDDHFAEHPKILLAGPLATVAQIRGLCYCARYRTDGHLSKKVAGLLLYGLDGLSETAMVDAGLWEQNGSGYVIHDYLKYNPSRARSEEVSRKKAKCGRQGGLANAKQTGSTVLSTTEAQVVANAQQKSSRTRTRTRSTTTTSEASPRAVAGATAEVIQPAEGKVVKPGKAYVADPDVREAVKHWAGLFEKLCGEPPVMQWPKMCGQIGPIVRARGLLGAKELLDKFFASKDRLIVRSDYTLSAFFGLVNRLIGVSNGGGPTEPGKTGTMIQGLKNFSERARDEAIRQDRRLPAPAGETPRGVSAG